MKYPILLPNIFDHPFTYSSSLKLKVGDYVNVPFGKRVITGVVWDQFEKNDIKKFKIKSVKEKLNIEPLKKEMVSFLNWFSNYNLVPLGMALKLHLLGGNAIEMKKKSEYHKYQIIDNKKNFNLSDEQQIAFAELIKKDNSFRVHLLQGTTGSGKTIVYFKALEKILKKHKQILILLPEIGLTGEFEKNLKIFLVLKQQFGIQK